MIIPADDHHIVIGLLRAIIIECTGFLPIIPLSLRSGRLRHIARALHASVFINRLLDRFRIFRPEDLKFLHMIHRLCALRRISVSVWIICFRHGPLPGQQIRRGHRIIAACVLSQPKMIPQRHMIGRKLGSVLYSGFQGLQRCKCPAGVKGPLVRNPQSTISISKIESLRKSRNFFTFLVCHMQDQPLTLRTIRLQRFRNDRSVSSHLLHRVSAPNADKGRQARSNQCCTACQPSSQLSLSFTLSPGDLPAPALHFHFVYLHSFLSASGPGTDRNKFSSYHCRSYGSYLLCVRYNAPYPRKK